MFGRDPELEAVVRSRGGLRGGLRDGFIAGVVIGFIVSSLIWLVLP